MIEILFILSLFLPLVGAEPQKPPMTKEEALKAAADKAKQQPQGGCNCRKPKR